MTPLQKNVDIIHPVQVVLTTFDSYLTIIFIGKYNILCPLGTTVRRKRSKIHTSLLMLPPMTTYGIASENVHNPKS